MENEGQWKHNRKQYFEHTYIDTRYLKNKINDRTTTQNKNIKLESKRYL